MKAETREFGPLTLAEEIVLNFLESNKGVEFTSGEIEEYTGIPASFIGRITDNLRWKGYDIATESHRGVHYYIHNTWRSYVVGGLMAGFSIAVGIYGVITMF